LLECIFLSGPRIMPQGETRGFGEPSQTLGFDRKLGYLVFGELDYPPEHKRYFLQKQLASGA
jgi:hypothetical protein